MDVKSSLETLACAPRFAGSPHSKACSEFIAETFRRNGLSVELQRNLFMGWALVREPKVEFLAPEKLEAKCIPLLWSGSTPSDGVEGRLVFAGKFLTFEAYQWLKYAVVDGSGFPRAYLLTRPDMVWMQTLDNPALTAPYIIVDTDSCKRIGRWLKQGKEVRVRAFVKTEFRPDSVLTNVVAESRGAKKPVIISAHYDSVTGVDGAQDNASGVAALLALSQRLKAGVRFIAFDAEEWNKLGAYTYVAQQKGKKLGSPSIKKKQAREKSALDNIRLVINLDSVGAGERIYVLAHKRFHSAVRKAAKGLKFPVDITPDYKSPQFDAWPFHREGIPVIEVGTTPYAYFHKKEDTLDKLDPAILMEVVRLVERIVKGVK